MDRADLSALARRLLTAFSWADLDSMRALLRLPPIARCQTIRSRSGGWPRANRRRATGSRPERERPAPRRYHGDARSCTPGRARTDT
jgi:hypothetical protein